MTDGSRLAAEVYRGPDDSAMHIATHTVYHDRKYASFLTVPMLGS